MRDLSNPIVTLGSPNLDLGIVLNILDTFQLAHIHPRSLRHFQNRSLGHLFRFDFLIAWFFRLMSIGLFLTFDCMRLSFDT